MSAMFDVIRLLDAALEAFPPESENEADEQARQYLEAAHALMTGKRVRLKGIAPWQTGPGGTFRGSPGGSFLLVYGASEWRASHATRGFLGKTMGVAVPARMRRRLCEVWAAVFQRAAERATKAGG